MVKQERAVRTREALIRSAAEIFDREGFTGASLTAICARAGVSSGALHFHFTTKAALANAVEEAAARILRSITDRPAPARSSLLQHLVDVTHALAAALRQDAVLRAAFGLGADAARPPHADLRVLWQAWVARAMRRAEERGELCAGVTAEGAVTAVVAATVGFEALGARDAAWLSRRTITQFWLLLLPTIARATLRPELEAGGARTPA
ncbi:ScbR family autoregulator-binding transcription factor [Streptomyces rochei]|uniref:ScbR family autoregulator-binding transcription factor n=1 Tax=Streptomyces rochei TaxID=1928 RepID=UPI003696BD6A